MVDQNLNSDSRPHLRN